MADVIGLDEGERQRRPIRLVGRREVSRDEVEIGQIEPATIALSKVLSAACDFDPSTTRIVVDVEPEVLQLLLRFTDIVVRHNAKCLPAQVLPRSSYPVSAATTPHKIVPSNDNTLNPNHPINNADTKANLNTTNLVDMGGDWKNRARHLPLVLGESAELGAFMDALVEEPAALWAMHVGAERLLLEPAQTATLLKFATLLDGLSIRLQEIVWADPVAQRGACAASIARALASTAPAAKATEPAPDAAPAQKRNRRGKPAPTHATIILPPPPLPSSDRPSLAFLLERLPVA